MTIGTISPREAQTLLAQGAKLIDIRDADEYLREHIPQAHLAPLSALDQGYCRITYALIALFFTASRVSAHKMRPQN